MGGPKRLLPQERLRYFRDQVIWLDYDELLEMYVEETVHPAVRPPWQSPGNYAYFQSEVMGQMA